MRPAVKRRLVRLATMVAVTLSSVLLLVTGVLWVRSCDVFDVLIFSRASYAQPRCTIVWRGVGIGLGRLILYRKEFLEVADGRGRYIDRRYAGGRLVFERQLRPATTNTRAIPWHGFGYKSSSDGGPDGVAHETTIWIPLWLFGILFAAYPVAVWIKHANRLERVAAGRCAHCGYDLRTTPDRCPECGAARAGPP